jgi:hypothetical protein
MREIAFLDRFQISPYGLCDVKVLNSGVTLPGINIEFETETFSFLKLHGSVVIQGPDADELCARLKLDRPRKDVAAVRASRFK